MSTTLVPAYGRDYKSAKAAREDFLGGKDFQIANFFDPDNGRYVNVAQLPAGTTVNIRYKKLANVTVIKVPG